MPNRKLVWEISQITPTATGQNHCVTDLAPECPEGKVVQDLLPVAGLIGGQQGLRCVSVEGVVRFVEPMPRAVAVAEDPFEIALGADPVFRPAICSPRPRTGSDQGGLGMDGGGGGRMEHRRLLRKIYAVRRGCSAYKASGLYLKLFCLQTVKINVLHPTATHRCHAAAWCRPGRGD